MEDKARIAFRRALTRAPASVSFPFSFAAGQRVEAFAIRTQAG